MSQSSLSLETVLQQSYAQARQLPDNPACMVVLHLGAEHSGLVVGVGPRAQTVQSFDLGLQRLVARYFKTTPPTPLAMEHAIMVVEDVVMPLRGAIPRQAQLFSCDAALREIALLAGVVPEGAGGTAPLVLSLEAMERTFNRLSNVVEGRPAAHEGLPASNAFAAALLVLREFMHHLQFERITLLQTPAP